MKEVNKEVKNKKAPVLITTDKDKRGVFMGYIDIKTANDLVLVVDDIRMCVKWTEDVKGVLGLAANGPSKTCRVSPAAKRGRISGVTSVVELTEKSEKAWKLEPWG
jgi:hypothetical protein